MTDLGGGAARILLVEDDRPLREMLAGILDDHGYDVTAVGDGIQAAQALHARPFEVVLLDIGLPFVDGWQLLRQLDGSREPSVIVISARGDEDGKVRALDLGADDYLTKPFGARELLARLRAVLRRSAVADVDTVVRVDDVVVDLQARAVSRAGEEVRLSPIEWLLLATMAQHPGVAIDQRTLLATVWGPDYISDRNYLKTFVNRLRHKLEREPTDPRIIITVGRQGYRLGPMAVEEGRGPGH